MCTNYAEGGLTTRFKIQCSALVYPSWLCGHTTRETARCRQAARDVFGVQRL